MEVVEDVPVISNNRQLSKKNEVKKVFASALLKVMKGVSSIQTGLETVKAGIETSFDIVRGNGIDKKEYIQLSFLQIDSLLNELFSKMNASNSNASNSNASNSNASNQNDNEKIKNFLTNVNQVENGVKIKSLEDLYELPISISNILIRFDFFKNNTGKIEYQLTPESKREYGYLNMKEWVMSELEKNAIEKFETVAKKFGEIYFRDRLSTKLVKKLGIGKILSRLGRVKKTENITNYKAKNLNNKVNSQKPEYYMLFYNNQVYFMISRRGERGRENLNQYVIYTLEQLYNYLSNQSASSLNNSLKNKYFSVQSLITPIVFPGNGPLKKTELIKISEKNIKEIFREKFRQRNSATVKNLLGKIAKLKFNKNTNNISINETIQNKFLLSIKDLELHNLLQLIFNKILYILNESKKIRNMEDLKKQVKIIAYYIEKIYELKKIYKEIYNKPRNSNINTPRNTSIDSDVTDFKIIDYLINLLLKDKKVGDGNNLIQNVFSTTKMTSYLNDLFFYQMFSKYTYQWYKFETEGGKLLLKKNNLNVSKNILFIPVRFYIEKIQNIGIIDGEKLEYYNKLCDRYFGFLDFIKKSLNKQRALANKPEYWIRFLLKKENEDFTGNYTVIVNFRVKKGSGDYVFNLTDLINEKENINNKIFPIISHNELVQKMIDRKIGKTGRTVYQENNFYLSPYIPMFYIPNIQNNIIFFRKKFSSPNENEQIEITEENKNQMSDYEIINTIKLLAEYILLNMTKKINNKNIFNKNQNHEEIKIIKTTYTKKLAIIMSIIDIYLKKTIVATQYLDINNETAKLISENLSRKLNGKRVFNNHSESVTKANSNINVLNRSVSKSIVEHELSELRTKKEEVLQNLNSIIEQISTL